MIAPNNSKSFVKFFDPKVLKKERELINSWDYEICNQYGMDCLFVSQKAKFPKTKLIPFQFDSQRETPRQNDLFFHAYGEISRPEYNEPFPTRVYVQFTEDLFTINGFGLNTDINTTLIFNKTSFALDGALAMADNQTINKQFTFTTEIPENEKYAIINYKSKNLQFKAKFDWKAAVGDKFIEGKLFEFNIDPENFVKPDVLNTFKRRYSASKFLETCKLYFKCKDLGSNILSGGRKIFGNCIANFVVKNPWKPYSELLNRLTPSVGDLVLLNGIDDNIIKLEITEVESENKTQQGISPLLGSYSFKCIAKPYIADNNASALNDPITAPTDINAKKLIIQTVMNHDASKTTDHISKYEKLYTDQMGFDFTEDDIYGGYDLEPPNGITNPQNVPVHLEPINSNERTIYKWGKRFDGKKIDIKNDSDTIVTSYLPDTLYTYLKNLMDTEYTEYVLSRMNLGEISTLKYNVFDDDAISSNGWYKCRALNVDLWYNTISSDQITVTQVWDKEISDYVNISTITAYTEQERRLYQLSNSNEEVLSDFINKNKDFIDAINSDVLNGISNKYDLPLIYPYCYDEYVALIKDKKDAMPIDIRSSDVYELSSFLEISAIIDGEEHYYPDRVPRYIKNTDHKYNLRTDLYDIEQYNIGSSDFEQVIKDTTPQYKEWKKINIKKVNGPLVEIYRFENSKNSRFATNGKQLFFETTDNDGNLYSTEISSLELNTDVELKQSKEYNGLSVPLTGRLNWIEADDVGVYFNSAYGTRTRLYGDKKIDEEKFTHLNYENDISSPRDSFILTFKNSKFYFVVQPNSNGMFNLRLCQ